MISGYSVINSVIQSIIQPKYVAGAVNISLTLTFLSLISWTFVIGPLGAVLAIPLTLLTQALLLDVDPNTRWRKAAQDRSSRASTGRRSAARQGMGTPTYHCAQLGPLGRGEPVGAGNHRLQPGNQPVTGGGIAVGGVGVGADHEPLVVGDLDFVDPQVLAHLLVAALPRQAPRSPPASPSAASRRGCTRRRRPGGGGDWPRR